MSAAPDHITITVDEKALREQVRGIINNEMREMALKLRHAADVLDPEFMPRIREWHREELLREQKAAKKGVTE
jgi:hypothetical protein